MKNLLPLVFVLLPSLAYGQCVNCQSNVIWIGEQQSVTKTTWEPRHETTIREVQVPYVRMQVVDRVAFNSQCFFEALGVARTAIQNGSTRFQAILAGVEHYFRCAGGLASFSRGEVIAALRAQLPRNGPLRQIGSRVQTRVVARQNVRQSRSMNHSHGMGH